MNIHLPNFNVKNLVKEAGSTLSRVVQMTEEKFGTTERTEYETEFQDLAERADVTKIWTEKMVKNVEAVLVPNPQNRVEDFIFEKIDKSKPQRNSNLENLALDMIEAGADFGQDKPYGQTLVKVGQAEQKLGKCERDFIASTSICFTTPLRKFLEGEMKSITKERGILESKRLDLDACKTRVKKARSMLGQQAKDGITPEAVLEQAERDLRVAQSEFDRQSEITKSLLEGISTSQASHLRHLHAFVDTQVRYYKQGTETMKQLQKELAKTRPGQPLLRINSEDIETGSPNANQTSKQSSSTDNQLNRQITPIVNATNTVVAAQSLASYCQYDSVDLESLDHVDLSQTTTSVTHANKECDTRNPSKILDEFDLHLGGPTPYVPVELDDEPNNQSGNPFASRPTGNKSQRPNAAPVSVNADQMKRARVLCAYDAKDHTELTLGANEVILVCECSPINMDYMYGKQGLLKGLVPRAFIEMLDDEEEPEPDEQAISGDSDY